MRFAVAAVLAFAVAAGPVAAAEWTAGMEEDEGGPVMAASIYPDGGALAPAIRMMCFDQVGVRYDPGTETGESLYNTSIPFDFAVGGTTLSREMAYEDMDGMFAAYLDKNDTLIGLLTSGEEVKITDPTGKFGVQTMTLKGAPAAIKQVLDAC